MSVLFSHLDSYIPEGEPNMVGYTEPAYACHHAQFVDSSGTVVLQNAQVCLLRVIRQRTALRLLMAPLKSQQLPENTIVMCLRQLETSCVVKVLKREQQGTERGLNMDSDLRIAAAMALEMISKAMDARIGLCMVAAVADIAALSIGEVVFEAGRETAAAGVIDIAVGIVVFATVAPVESASVAELLLVKIVMIARLGSEDPAVVVVVAG